MVHNNRGARPPIAPTILSPLGLVFRNGPTTGFYSSPSFSVPEQAVYRGSGPLDPAFTTASVHSLQVISLLVNHWDSPDPYGGALAFPLAVPFANVVVPTGTPVSFDLQIAGDIPGDPVEDFIGLIPASGYPTIKSLNGASPNLADTAVAVPEPAGTAILMLGAIGLLRRRLGYSSS